MPVYTTHGVAGDGNCFFYAVYVSARCRNRIDLSKLYFISPRDGKRHSYDNKGQESFAAFMREMLFHSEEYTDALRKMEEQIHDWETLFQLFENVDPRYFQAIGLTYRGGSIYYEGQLIGHIERNGDWGEVVDATFADGFDPTQDPHDMLPKMRNLVDVRKSIRNKELWAQHIEVSVCKDFLKRFGIRLHAFGAGSAQGVADELVLNLPYLEKTIVVYTNGNHYFDICPKTPDQLTRMGAMGMDFEIGLLKRRLRYKDEDIEAAFDSTEQFNIRFIEDWLKILQELQLEYRLPRDAAVRIMTAAGLVFNYGQHNGSRVTLKSLAQRFADDDTMLEFTVNDVVPQSKIPAILRAPRVRVEPAPRRLSPLVRRGAAEEDDPALRAALREALEASEDFAPNAAADEDDADMRAAIRASEEEEEKRRQVESDALYAAKLGAAPPTPQRPRASPLRRMPRVVAQSDADLAMELAKEERRMQQYGRPPPPASARARTPKPAPAAEEEVGGMTDADFAMELAKEERRMQLQRERDEMLAGSLDGAALPPVRPAGKPSSFTFRRYKMGGRTRRLRSKKFTRKHEMVKRRRSRRS